MKWKLSWSGMSELTWNVLIEYVGCFKTMWDFNCLLFIIVDYWLFFRDVPLDLNSAVHFRSIVNPPMLRGRTGDRRQIIFLGSPGLIHRRRVTPVFNPSVLGFDFRLGMPPLYHAKNLIKNHVKSNKWMNSRLDFIYYRI